MMLESEVEESEERPEPVSDPPTTRHGPASEQTQDISHLLESIFTDVYTEMIGEDTVANLTKTRSTQHDHYVEEVHWEYSRRKRDADMLEKHIIQAGASQSPEGPGESDHRLGLPSVRSTFMWRVDNGLLKSNNLLCPQDYRAEQAPPAKAPRDKSTPSFANPTLASTRHVCKHPQDDGSMLAPPAERTAQSLLEESEASLTRASSSDNSTPRSTSENKSCRAGRPKCVEEPSAKSRAEERVMLQKLKERHGFLHNPRFLPPSGQRAGRSLILPRNKLDKLLVEESNVTAAESIPVFLANPAVVFFTDYLVGQVYETTLELRNLTGTSRHLRVLPPTTPHVSISLGRFPGEGGVVAPGMSCQYTVRFAPDSLADYEDFVVVETQAQYPLLVPIEARRPPPILTLPSVLDCGYCLVGGVRFVDFLCHNEGLSAGTFCIIPKSQWPASNLRSLVTASLAEQPPFAVSPSVFQLQPGQATVVEVVFFPSAAESCSQVFTIVCDNCQVKDVTIRGQGQLMGLELVCVSGEDEGPALGELCDLTAQHFIRLGPANPGSVQHKTFVIRNNTHLELPFHWQIMKPNLQALLPGQTPDPACIQYHLATDLVFQVSPPSGLLGPRQDLEFLLSYTPPELKDYHSVCHLVMRDIPDLPMEASEDGAPQSLDTTLKVNDVIAMEIEVKGSSEPYQILLEPYAILIPGQIFINTTVHRRFKMWNNSKSMIRFQWDRMSDRHIMEVAPSSGEIEMNECFDLELVLIGGEPGMLVTSLHCHIQHHDQPVVLPIEVSFKGPQLSLSVPRLDLGLLRLGDQGRSTLLITNTSPLEARWTCNPDTHTQISVEPGAGVLAPQASCSLEVLLRPEACQHFETILHLAVENGSACQLCVQVEVQAPQVCLLSCELVFPELYVGVAAEGAVTLFNQTLLPTHFSWSQSLQGKQASLCSAAFSPSSGTLGPNAKMEVTVTFTAHTDVELTEVAAVCRVDGMDDPLAMSFFCKAKRLTVSYSLPTWSSGDQNPSSPLVLDFGDDVVLRRAVTRQLVITNHTAIPAPFTMEAEYFTGNNLLQPAGQSQNKASRWRSQYSQAKKVEEREHEEFVSRLLSHGKGAAFFLQPDSGMLGAFETQSIDITAFTNMWGEYRDTLISKVGDLPPQPIPIQMTVRGCPLYFQMIGPQPEHQNQGPVIRFGTHVSGGDTVSRPIRLNNTSPYDIRVDWQSYNVQQGDRKLLDVVVSCGNAFPVKDADGNEVVGGAVALPYEDAPPTGSGSHTPSSEGTSSSLPSSSDVEEEEGTISEEDETGDEEGIPYLTAQKKKLFSVFIRPHEGNMSDYPYCITPQQMVVPAGGSSTVHVSFTPLSLSETREQDCVGYALAFMSLDSQVASCIPGQVQRSHGLQLQPLRLDLQASVGRAVLSVQMEDDGVLFYTAASDLLQMEPDAEIAVHKEVVIRKTFLLKNTLEMPLSFRLSTQAPFSVLQPQAQVQPQVQPQAQPQVQPQAQVQSQARARGRTATEDSQLLVLPPRHNMQVRVAFHSSPSLLACLSPPPDQAPPPLACLSPPPDQAPPPGTLVHGDTGERTLRFQQNLLVHYSNNSLQAVALCSSVALPTLRLSCACLDFGLCYVGQRRVREVQLYNRGGSWSYWTALIDSGEGCGLFRVTPDRGVLKPLAFPVSTCSQTLEISFTASDEESSRAAVTIKGILGELSLSLQLEGQGSYDERYRLL